MNKNADCSHFPFTFPNTQWAALTADGSDSGRNFKLASTQKAGAQSSAVKFDNRRGIGEESIVVDDRTVDEGDPVPGRLPAVAAMDVPEDVQPGFGAEQGGEQILTALMLAQDVVFVQSAIGRLMGDEDIGVLGNPVPMVTDFHQTLAGEGPVSTHRVDGRAPELQSFEGDSGVLQIGRFSEVRPGQLGLAVEEQIVIAGDDELVAEGNPPLPSSHKTSLLSAARLLSAAGPVNLSASRKGFPKNLRYLKQAEFND